MRYWIDGAERTAMIDLRDVVGITARLVPGATRNIPGGRTEQDASSYDVTLRLRSGQMERMQMTEQTWCDLRAALESAP